MGSRQVPEAASNSVCEKQGPEDASIRSSLRLGVAPESCSQWFLDEIYIGGRKYSGPWFLECLLPQRIYFSTGLPFHADTCMMSHTSFMWQRREHANMSQFTPVKKLRMLCCEFFFAFVAAYTYKIFVFSCIFPFFFVKFSFIFHVLFVFNLFID